MSQRKAPPQQRVERMFDAVVDRYDLVNDLLSLGLDRWWRRTTLRAMPARPGDRVLDFGCGTGALGARLAGRAEVVGMDLSHPMLVEAKRRTGGAVDLVRGSVFALPFADEVFRGVMSAFVLRNLEDLPGALRELARVTAPGGALAIVDITGPQSRALRRPFDAYFGTVAPLLGRMTGQGEAYRYLARSLAQLPKPQELCVMLEDAGFRLARARGLTGGMVTLWTAIRT